MGNKFMRIKVPLSYLLMLGCLSVSSQSLEKNFKTPPSQAKPSTWMHAMSGNMSKEGLTKDLESINYVGIGGVLLFNVTQGIPLGPIKYNSAQHHEMIKHAAAECERLGLSFGVHNCDGWSSSGGPWITPAQSMKMVVWTETVVNGGKVQTQLPQPTTREGFYRDIAVLAYPALASELADSQIKPVVTASDSKLDIGVISDTRIDNKSVIEKKGTEEPWIQYDYGKSHTLRSAHITINDRNAEIKLQFSQDGKIFTDVKELFKVRTGKGEWVCVDHFEPITAIFFRLVLNQTTTIKEASLMATYNTQNFLARTSMSRTDDAHLQAIGNPEPRMVIAKNEILDITGSMDAKGVLKTKLPQGNWTILRFGYTSTGAFNNPASDEGRGLECDKFSRQAFKTHYDAFVKKVISNVREVAPNAMQYIEIDSYEMGGQNWTDDFEEIFKNKKGYEIRSFLPLYAGKFIDSPQTSDAILWDLRDVHSNLMTENYFGYFSELCHEDGVKSYIEPYGFGPVNDLDVGGKADMVMGEFWMNRPLTQVASAVSSGHIYGKEIISAESFTSTPEINWKGHPALAKLSGDKAWAAGINEFMFHRFVHQANTQVKPGLTMNRWGFHFDRTQTWWESAGKAWFRYIARGSYMLRQGVPVSDLLVYIGEGSPNSVFSRVDFDPAIPHGTNFDCVNTDVLLHRIIIKEGFLELPEGTRYQMLALKNCQQLSLATLNRLHQIAQAGIPIVGTKPQKQPGYLASSQTAEDFNNLVAEIWALPNVYESSNWSNLSEKHQLVPDFKIEGRDDIMFIHRKTKDSDFYFFYNPDSLHQTFECTFKIEDKIPEMWNPQNGETMKLARFKSNNGSTKAWITLEAQESAFIVFRESSKGVKAIQAIEKENSHGSYYLDHNNQITLLASENGTYGFNLNSDQHKSLKVNNLPKDIEIEGAWDLEFLKENDYEANHIIKQLTDWKDHPNEQIKYYSGTAIYRKSFNLPSPKTSTYNRVILNLGKVSILAQVTLNGKYLGVQWMSPFKLDITDALVAGENKLEIAVTNQWTNRLIGDEHFPKQDGGFKLDGYQPHTKMPDWYVNNEPIPRGPRTTFCSGGFYKASDPLVSSGLLGPVTIRYQKIIHIK